MGFSVYRPTHNRWSSQHRKKRHLTKLALISLKSALGSWRRGVNSPDPVSSCQTFFQKFDNFVAVIAFFRAGRPGSVPVGGRREPSQSAAVPRAGPEEDGKAGPRRRSRVGEQDRDVCAQNVLQEPARAAHDVPIAQLVSRRCQYAPVPNLD